MSRDPTHREVARARLAYITAGDPLPAVPRRALEVSTDEPVATEPPSATGDTGTAPEIPGAAPQTASTALGIPGTSLGVTRRHIVVVALILLCGVGIAVASLTSSRASPVPIVTPSVHVSSRPPSPEPTPTFRVHVLGAVRSPGVVALPAGSIVDDALAAAGGLTEQADVAELNLAAPLADGQQVLVGTTSDPRGEVVGSAALDPGGTPGGGLDLNTASQDQLEELPDVGPVLATAIIAHREQHGSFTSVAQLREVSGIGPKTYSRLEPLVRV